jgi:hypothetical protein
VFPVLPVPVTIGVLTVFTVPLITRRTIMKLTICTLISLAAAPLSANPQGLEIGVEDSVIVPSSGGYAEFYGRSIDISGDVIAVGAVYNDDLGANAGAAYVHRWNGTDWIEEATLHAWDGIAGEEFGRTLALDGDTLVICTDKPGGGTGAAYVFARIGGSWQQQQKLAPTDGLMHGGFGSSVALEGERIAVGAPLDNTLGEQAGSVYIFERSGTTWAGTDKLYANDGQAYHRFGHKVEIDGSTLGVTAIVAEGIAPGSGAAYVFTLSGASWTFQDKLFAPDGLLLDYLGRSLGLDGDTLVMGSGLQHSLGLNVGAAYVFTRSGTTWSFDEKLVAPDWAEEDCFGDSIAFQGECLVIGAPSDGDVGPYGGSAYQYHRQAGSWVLTNKLLPSDEVNGFSMESAIDGSTIILSAPTGAVWGRVHVLSDPPRVVGASLTFGDGSSAPCPCGNESQVGLGVGCANSTGLGARLHGIGSTSVTDDDLGFWASRLPAGQFCLLWGGDTIVGSGMGLPFGDGLRAVGGVVVRLGVRLAGSTGAARWKGGLCARAGWASGATAYLQAWYRDPHAGPCGFEFNTSNAVEIGLTQ